MNISLVILIQISIFLLVNSNVKYDFRKSV